MQSFLSFLPIAALIAALVVFKLPAWKAALAALAVGVAVAAGMSCPVSAMASAAAGGAKTGLFPIGLVIVAALFTYAVTVESGAMEEIKRGLTSLSPDRRFLALVVVWGFGNFMEGMAGFGTAVAIPCAILVGIGFDPMRAVLCCLVANTTPTAFGSVGVPTAVLAGETDLALPRLSQAVALLQLAVTAISPFLVVFIADGSRGVREKWRLALLADVAFIVPWLVVAATCGCELPDVVGGLSVMLVMAFAGERRGIDLRRQAWAWLPFGLVVAVLGASAALPPRFRLSPGLLVLAAGFAGGLCQRLGPARLARLFAQTCRRYSLALATICAVLALAKVMGAAGMTENLADAVVAATGSAYAAVSGAVGALGGFVTGSGTSTNVLFGSLQASVGTGATDKLIFASANVMGAGIGKMICPQSIVFGCATAGIAGRESEVMKRALPYFAVVLALACAVTAVVSLCGHHAVVSQCIRVFWYNIGCFSV